jgi:flavin prenyltransferase
LSPPIGRITPSPGPLIVGITGASGVVYGVRLLQVLRDLQIDSHLVVTKAGEMTAVHEHSMPVREIRALATRCYSISDVGAAIASGSFRTMGMIVAPCSMNTLAEIAGGLSSNLLTRAADVCLKERRPLVLMARETPLHRGHLKSMLAVTDMGGIIAPPVPAFYARSETVDDLVNHSVGRVLELFGIETALTRPWAGLGSSRSRTGQVEEVAS